MGHTCSIQQKKRIFKEKFRRLRKGRNITNIEVGVWEKAHLNMTQAPSKAALPRIFKQSAYFRKVYPLQIGKKRRNMRGKHHAMKQELSNWGLEQRTRRINMNGDIIRHIYLKMQELGNEDNTGEEDSCLRIS